MRRVLREGLFAVLAAAAVAMTGVLVLVMSGKLVSDPADEPGSPVAVPREAPRAQALRVRRTSAATTTAATTAAATTAAATTTAAPVSHAPPPATTLTVSATRGDCWVEVRRTSATGEVLFSGVLPQGESRDFASRKLWLRLGAAGNVDLVVDGKQQPVPSGTPELTLPA